MSRRLRLDAELVRRGLARSREHAGSMIEEGLVKVGGSVASKAATGVTTDQAIVVRQSKEPTYASRGAHKLLGALAVFEPLGLSVEGRRCLDAGASTGGFTDVLLRKGAREVCAVDVGYGQLVWALQSDERVHVYDRTNVRNLEAADIGGPVQLVVSDLSFISLTVVMPALTRVCEPSPEGDIVLMIKPQFEVGRSNLGKNGVVRDPALHADAVLRVCRSAHELGWGTRALAPSPLPGPAGNVEYFCWLRSDADAPTEQAARDVVAAGPLDTSGASA
ncbi:TlyA family RNA methyltransferase [Aeromicrobium chenweiae]|uniref:16S/23S rRNA (Cytidine-2'-O)-methyltransferase n=1 Tax=Aeromicrobium chenweiae TaxID=2079793 RepID=A0A2S0WMG7_9ACTN|nr:TlyA family RNA methyltransferase [Aeromicrobium chenweiae]AWB92492.1 16S/23S rRNA (cytidine-2'-O)-methyltransferase [Aeromicrobium chenweiae]TGN31217.1 TlyA family RNA methyltransferase [Aeromicrobium chenweiae]